MNADAKNILSDLTKSIKKNIVDSYNTDRPMIEGWIFDTQLMKVQSLSVKDFPEKITFNLFYSLEKNTDKGPIKTYEKKQFSVVPNERIVFDRVVYVSLTPTDTVNVLKSKFKHEPTLEELFPNSESFLAFPQPTLRLSLDQYRSLIAIGQGYRGFPEKVQGHYWRMLYFSAGIATANALGDIVPLTSKARLIVTSQALISLVVIGLFLNTLVHDITKINKNSLGDPVQNAWVESGYKKRLTALSDDFNDYRN